jgi:hypothetical protein
MPGHKKRHSVVDGLVFAPDRAEFISFFFFTMFNTELTIEFHLVLLETKYFP